VVDAHPRGRQTALRLPEKIRGARGGLFSVQPMTEARL
jgi:hypothetical protein